MPFQQITGFIFIAFISAMAACNTSPPDAKTQSANEEKVEKEKSTLPFFNLEGRNVTPKEDAVEGFTKTATGLQYRILREGTGPKPTASNTVLAHYEGQLTDGTLFDSSYKKGQPISFPLNGVISGWTEGMQLIGEGGKIEFIIPSQLGYGARGEPRAGIPGGATLQFIVELQKVK